jgi:hypothetical protein
MALRADSVDDWEAGLRHLEEASALGPLPLAGQVINATLLLRGKRGAEAQAALNTIVADLADWDAPTPKYLKAYCESLLQGIWQRACMAEMGKVAPQIPRVGAYWKGRFPIPDCRYCDVMKSL